MGLNRKIRLQTSYICFFCYEMECFGPKATVLRKILVVATPGATHSESKKKNIENFENFNFSKISFVGKFRSW